MAWAEDPPSRTNSTASIVFYTALFMTLMAVPVLPFFWVMPSPLARR